MMKTKYILILGIFTLFINSCNKKIYEINRNKIDFEISDYNLLFTTVEINDKKYTALIDFGDFAEFQVSTKLIAELGLKTEKSDLIMYDVNGNEYLLEKGILDEIKVDGIVNKNITFFSANNEIETVSKEVGTEFQLVIGFGYFKLKNFEMDFVKNQINFLKTNPGVTDFSVSVNNDFGYLIGSFQSTSNHRINLLFDTGTPISIIDLNQLNLDLKDSLVYFQDVTFPSKRLDLKSKDQTIRLNMENNDIAALQPLGVVGIYGVNDMIGKVFTYSNSDKNLRIKTTD